jgi:RNA polymerase sigma factor (sigma-70 family)
VKDVLPIINAHEKRLLLYALRLCKDQELSRDAVQDTFVKYCKEAPNVHGNVTSWLYTVCRNRVFELLRKERRMRAMSVEESVAIEEKALSPAETTAGIDDKSSLLGLLNKLPEREQEIIRLKFQGNLSYKEISEVTGLTTTNVGFILHNSIKTLRTLFAERNNFGGQS